MVFSLISIIFCSKPALYLLMNKESSLSIFGPKKTDVQKVMNPAATASDALNGIMTLARTVKDRPNRSANRLLLESIAILIAIFLLLTALSFLTEPSFEKKLQRIPPRDRAHLDAFFRILILKEGGGYVLFGDKPAAFTTFSSIQNPSLGLFQIRKYEHENKLIKEGWQTWEKYSDLFLSKKFILECKRINADLHEICLINKNRFQQAIKGNLKDFQQVLGSQISPNQLLEDYQKDTTSLFHHLHEHHALLGILLGFGTKNSWLFHETTELRFEDPYAQSYHPLKKIYFSSQKFDQYKLASVFKENNHKKCFKFLYLPYFLADTDSEETALLQEQYRKEQQIVHQAYSENNFLEITLRKFCS